MRHTRTGPLCRRRWVACYRGVSVVVSSARRKRSPSCRSTNHRTASISATPAANRIMAQPKVMRRASGRWSACQKGAKTYRKTQPTQSMRYSMPYGRSAADARHVARVWARNDHPGIPRRPTAVRGYNSTEYSDWHTAPRNARTSIGGTDFPRATPHSWGLYANLGTRYWYTRVLQWLSVSNGVPARRWDLAQRGFSIRRPGEPLPQLPARAQGEQDDDHQAHEVLTARRLVDTRLQLIVVVL